MRRRSLALVVLVASLATTADRAGTIAPVVVEPTAVDTSATDAAPGMVFMCPMDPDVRSNHAGNCRRCGMTLVAGVPEPVEFHVDLTSFPSAPQPGRASVLQFAIHDPWKDRPVASFNPVHEKLFHAFVVSQDLQFFEHGHPAFVAEGRFQYPTMFPKPGMYRVLGDFYPEGGLPQLSSSTVLVAGQPPPPPQLTRDYSAKTTANLTVSLETIPAQPVATVRTQLRLVVRGSHPLEKYLGVWGHMLVASSDLIDMMHEHPFLADGGERVEFDLVFPRPGVHRVWVQFQSDGIVNTAHFDVPVEILQ